MLHREGGGRREKGREHTEPGRGGSPKGEPNARGRLQVDHRGTVRPDTRYKGRPGIVRRYVPTGPDGHGGRVYIGTP